MKALKRLTLGMLFGILASYSIAAPGKKPNIVLLYIDDWAWNGSSVAMHPDMQNSRMPVVQMPNIDRLAREGMVFQNAYGSPQCSPARACILTGQTSARNGFTVYMNPRNDTYFDTNKEYEGFKVVGCIANKTMDPAATFGIPKALAPMGYVSAHVGKWHMRSDPGAHGYAVHDGDTDNNPGNTIKKGLKKGEAQPRRLTEENMKDPKSMFSITEKAIGFMEKQVKADKPFYVQISHYAMHAGSECKIATREKYVKHPLVQAWYKQHDKTAENVARKDDPAVWLGMADDLDGRIGAVLDKIDALGIADNTYVVMVADNGYRHEFLPGLTQPLHARKWWVWEGGIRVPMIVKGPTIAPGGKFAGNVVNYDLLPTFVDWAGGDSKKLKDIDGVSLAPYMAGSKPGQTFLNRNLYFHYPHYRATMPHTAVISGSHKALHFWEHPDIPMLFDLSRDIGEVSNIAEEQPELHKRLFNGMMAYLKQVDGRIPKPNPDYDPEKYRADADYWDRINWGPFRGRRPLDDDERESFVNPEETRNKGKLQVRFKNLEEGARFPAGSELRVEVEVTAGEAVQEVKLYMDGLLLNAQGMTTTPQVWSGSGDHLLSSLKPGRHQLKVTAKGKTKKGVQQEIQITVGDVSDASAKSSDEIYRVILDKGDRLMGGEAHKFPRLECLLKLELNGKLMLRDEVRGRLFEVPSNAPKGPHYAAVENGQLKIYRGKPDQPGKALWESPNPPNNAAHKLGITNSKRLLIFREADGGKQEIAWMSPARN